MTPRRGLDLNTIVSVAAEMADSEGVEAVTLASLSERLGIRPPSLYNHVSGLSGLRQQLAVVGLRQLTDAIAAAIEAAEDKSSSVGSDAEDIAYADSVMIEVAREYLAFARKHPGLYELTLRSPQEQEVEYVAESERLIGLLLGALKPYGLEHDRAVHIIRGFRSYLHGFASLEQKGGFGLPLEVDDSVELTIHVYLLGLRQLV